MEICEPSETLGRIVCVCVCDYIYIYIAYLEVKGQNSVIS